MSQIRIHDFFKRAKISKLSPDVDVDVSSSIANSVGAAADEEPESITVASNSANGSSTVLASSTSNVERFEKPCQLSDFSYPGRRFGTETFERSFQPSWISKWQWLHYVTDKDYVLCFVCCKAKEKGFRHSEGKSSFISGGFTNWRKATTKFAIHDVSDLHLESVRMLASLNQKPISAMISEHAANEQKVASTVLELLFRSIRLLAREGIPLRGHNHRDGVLWQMMLERTYDNPKVRDWMRRRDNWMSDTIQNEILEILAHAVQRHIVSDARGSAFFGLTADGTTDVSSNEQFSCSLQYVGKDLSVNNVFLGFYNAPDSTADTLFSCIRDFFIRLNLPMDRLQGFCFDGASNMSGRFAGVQAKLKEQCPGALYVHCANHALDLILQEAAREVQLVADTLTFVQNLSVIIGESAKRKAIFQSCFGGDDVVCNLLSLCPTRWAVRTKAIKRVCCSYGVVLETIKVLQQDKSMRGESRAKLAGLYIQATKGKTYFGLVSCEALFEPCEEVAKVLQHKKANVGGALECVSVLKKQMCALREDTCVKDLIRKVEMCAAQYNLKMPHPPRTSKTPARLRNTQVAEDIAPRTGHQQWQREFFEAVDIVTSELDRRFDQPGMKTAAKREKTITDAASGLYSGLDDIAPHLPTQIDQSRLHMQLTLLGSLTKDKGLRTSTDIAEFLGKLHPQTRELMNEVEKFMELCLSLPVSVASSERSFSTLRRLKTWLRSTMTQKRLTHLALLHVHQETLDMLDIQPLMKAFVQNTAERKATFGIIN